MIFANYDNTKNNKNSRKKFAGFTLVELIVVIAIIGVLAAVLVPSMMGYVSKAKFSSANSMAKTLFNAGMAACREHDVTKPIPTGVYTSEKVRDEYPSQGLTYDEKIYQYIYEYFSKIEDKYWAVRIENDVVTGVCFQKTKGDVYVGTHPTVNNERRETSDFTFEKAIYFAETGNWTTRP
ncbi:MAG: prepilin-type N-terminal cleavage/methylation domain-containing protein [Oscillospiraceae bacterium]|nr:prepilin-type N-terminal cleavage/methylation domain-containing protein [Oscillospiraceae bacterium]